MAFGVRHQSACATHQSAASCSAAVAGIRVSGYRAGHRRSRSGVAGRSGGGANAAVPVIYPDSSGVAQVDKRRPGLERFTGRSIAVRPASVLRT